jgi:excinuclease ABC subunit C
MLQLSHTYSLLAMRYYFPKEYFSNMNDELIEKLSHLPDQPGVYLMKDAQERIIYVGKAVVLKNRVRSYFQSSRNHSPKVQSMVSRIVNLEYIVTASEIEALILECNLIKKHRPKYNISLRDDKTYPYIKVTINEEFPRLYATRRVQKDGARYFGPYTSAGAVHETIKLMRKLFPLRSCRILDARRPCLEYHIKRCLAPCAGFVDAATYQGMIKEVCLLLEGRSDTVVQSLKKKMEVAAQELAFEQAAKLRDQLAAVEKVREKQNIVTGAGDQDAIGLARSALGTCAQVFFIRSGKMVGRDHFLLAGSDQEEDEAVLAAFLKQYYSQSTFIPKEILLPMNIEEQSLLGEWLSQLKGSRVAVETPKRGTKKDIVTMADGNAALVLQEQEGKIKAHSEQTEGALADLGRYLGLDGPPERMECFDISHIQGSETVASMVVFESGMPKKEEYRRYKLLTVEGKPDDFKSMQEVVSRRYAQGGQPPPDLIIIDGGKGQLSSALEIIRGAGWLQVPVIGLAKEFEHIFREGDSEPLILPRHSQALYLIQRIRDEAHRFAVTYHRKLRSKRNMVSVLDHVAGIGGKRRKALWDHFGSLAKMKAATVEEMAAVSTMTFPAAQAVYNFFRQQGH